MSKTETKEKKNGIIQRIKDMPKEDKKVVFVIAAVSPIVLLPFALGGFYLIKKIRKK